VRKEWIKPGTHVNAIGADAPGKEELDPEILKTAKIVVDNFAQASHSGEINVPLAKGIISKENIYAELGEIIIGRKTGRESDNEITVFDSTGLAIQDISCARLVYDKARSLEAALAPASFSF
jgi:alanine dehydrogenase